VVEGGGVQLFSLSKQQSVSIPRYFRQQVCQPPLAGKYFRLQHTVHALNLLSLHCLHLLSLSAGAKPKTNCCTVERELEPQGSSACMCVGSGDVFSVVVVTFGFDGEQSLIQTCM
jgi:hypothetical protein